jgi:cation transport protein ChaC
MKCRNFRLLKPLDTDTRGLPAFHTKIWVMLHSSLRAISGPLRTFLDGAANSSKEPLSVIDVWPVSLHSDCIFRPIVITARDAGGIFMAISDPFHHHPELRNKIKPAATSFFRDMDISVIDAHAAQAGFPSDWRTPCEDREAARHEWLKNRWDRDLWVFAYGSLMWDPAFEFIDVRHSHCRGYQRSFCLWDEGGRGSFDEPGLMLAIDEGGHCEGLAFRIEAKKLDPETFVLFRREMLAAVYRPTWFNLETADGPIEALGFVANHDHEEIKPGIPLHNQATMIALAEGMFGTNFDYLSDMQRHLKALGIEDDYVTDLYTSVCALRSASTGRP